jgi:hypothetical protein
LGASTVKWTTSDPCLVLSESDSILHIKFEYYEVKNHRHFKNILIYKPKQFMMATKISKKNLHILGDTGSGVEVGDIEQVIVLNLFKNDKITLN